jgi:hypothetical protein
VQLVNGCNIHSRLVFQAKDIICSAMPAAAEYPRSKLSFFCFVFSSFLP